MSFAIDGGFVRARLTHVLDPVFFRSHCGRPSIGQETGITDQRVSNVGSAVEFAKGNNLLGIFIDAELLVSI